MKANMPVLMRSITRMGPRNQMNLASRPQNRHELKFTRHKFKEIIILQSHFSPMLAFARLHLGVATSTMSIRMTMRAGTPYPIRPTLSM